MSETTGTQEVASNGQVAQASDSFSSYNGDVAEHLGAPQGVSQDVSQNSEDSKANNKAASAKPNYDVAEMEKFYKSKNINLDFNGLDEKNLSQISSIYNSYKEYDRGAQEKFRQAAEKEKEYQRQLEYFNDLNSREKPIEPSAQAQEVEDVSAIRNKMMDDFWNQYVEHQFDLYGVSNFDDLKNVNPIAFEKIQQKYLDLKKEAEITERIYAHQQNIYKKQQEALKAQQRQQELQNVILSRVEEYKKKDPEFFNKVNAAGIDSIATVISETYKVPVVDVLANEKLFNFFAESAMAKHESETLKNQMAGLIEDAKKKAVEEYVKKIESSKMKESLSTNNSIHNDSKWLMYQKMFK